MKLVVLGAGVVGVASAWFLSRQGFEVTVVDRQGEPAAETSFANGGQISVSHAEPWANPAAPMKILRWLGRRDAPLLFRLQADPAQWRWGLAFLRECTRERARHNIAQLVRLGLYSRETLQALRRETGIVYDERTRGILHFYTSAAEFEAAREPARLMTELGCERRVVSADEAVAIEPALRQARPMLVGATYTAADESGDACRFTRELAAMCRARGVRFLMNHRVTALRAAGGRIEHVEAIDAEGRYVRIDGDRYVLSLGSHSARLAAPLGLRLNIYPAKGYSLTMPLRDAALANEVSLTDDEYKLVFSRLGDRLRVAGTAELGGYGRALDRTRCAAILRRVEQLFPGAGDASRVEYWSGLRPATPSNLPYIGASRIANLFLNTGHGTLGWTQACGSGRALADLVAGRRPEVDFAFCGAPGARSPATAGCENMSS
ncbi:MAG: D-amino acid dehydrogenase [Burkholderiaceae bacterium]|nr:D-amino acid dehydrogenase [Burkholderiaceae bacterium]